MRKFAILFLLIIVSFTTILSQDNVVITGNAVGKANKLVRIIVYSDLFSGAKYTLAETRTNSEGSFSINLKTNKTQFAFLAFELEKGEFYLSPDSEYNFSLNLNNSNNGSIFDRLPLNFSLTAKDGGIQNQIEEFNISYNNFIYNNVNSIYKGRNKTKITDFTDSIRTIFSNKKSEYIVNYAEYSLASLLWLSKVDNDKSILRNYFINRPVLYSNIQYVDFFKEFFNSYFDSENIYSYNELMIAVNSRSISVLDDLLSQDSLLSQDNRVREIVAMLLLSRNYHNRDVKKDRIISLLESIAKNSAYTENKLIARNFIVELGKLQNGSPAPDFNLFNNNDQLVKLNSFKGDFALLCFVKDNCNICNFQMEQINDLKNEFDNKLQVVTIVAGNETKKIATLSKEKGYNWSILRTDENIVLLEDYNVKTYPTYILINPDGTIAYATLPMPDEKMDFFIRRFMKSYNEKNN